MYQLIFSFNADFSFTAVIYGFTVVNVTFGYFNFLGIRIGPNLYGLSAGQM